MASLWYRVWLKMDNPDATILNFMYHGEEHLPKCLPYLYVLHSPASQIPDRYEYARDVVKRFKKLRIIAISKMVEYGARPFFSAIPMDLIYNGTDTDVFKPSNGATKGEKFKIITAAAFEPRKGIHLMIEALKGFELNDQLEYHIYGGGSEEYAAQLQNMIKEYGLENVAKLKGSVTNISDIMPEYDLFALPSKGEAFALSPIEAMACGVPILVSDCPPYPEYVAPDFGFMVNREKPKEIQQAIREMFTNQTRFQNMKVAARKAALRFSWASVVKQYINSINEVSK
jgi:glycosyltransferase involved in cell wall biosynthesis